MLLYTGGCLIKSVDGRGVHNIFLLESSFRAIHQYSQSVSFTFPKSTRKYYLLLIIPKNCPAPIGAVCSGSTLFA